MLDAVESVGFLADGRQLALNSYENRVYQVGLEEDQAGPLGDARFLVAKFYRPGRWTDEQILEEHGFAGELAEREIPVVPALEIAGATLHHHGGFRFALFPRRGGRAPELEDPHDARMAGPLHRPHPRRGRVEALRAPARARRRLLRHRLARLAARERFRAGRPARCLVGRRRARDRGRPGAPSSARPTRRRIRLHGDCHAGNVLWTPGGPHFVDFDDARTGPAVQDLWMLLSGDRASMSAQLRHVLAGYEDFAEFDDRELALVEPLRTLRLLHYSAWIARRWDDPAFPMAFPWFNTQRYWQDRVLELKEQVAAMQEPALVPAR